MDKNAIIARGYALQEEYKEQSKTLEKLTFDYSNGTEGIWIYPLEESNKPGQRFHFVFHNDPISLMGSPRPITGLVGIATGNGSHSRAVAKIDECIAMFKKTGKPAIDYFWAIHNKSKETKPKNAKRICPAN